MKVLAALSGGVDSAVAAALACEAGHDVVGVHMALSSDPQECRIGSRGCCSVEDATDAARAAEHLGIPFYIWDLAAQFSDTVIADFIEQYRLGATPNPCVRCNEFVKFRELAARARALGFDAVCTGHYARILEGPSGPELHRALDRAKDQSYVLAVMGREELGRVLLPVGEAPSKEWIRARAAQLGLGVESKPDSYDICFIPDGDTQGFLRAHLGAAPGAIVTPEGERVGEHEGYWNFTVGQRRGLKLGNPAPDGRPRYVLRTDPQRNEVIVGAAELLSVNQIVCGDIVWLAEDDNGEPDPTLVNTDPALTGESVQTDTDTRLVTCQVRAHGTPVAVASVGREDGRADGYSDTETELLTVDLVTPLRGVATGQSLVLYRGTRVLAQATILSAHRR